MAETGRSFIKKFVGFSVVTWVSFALSLISSPIATRIYEPEVLGKINIYNTYLNLFSLIILLGMDQAYARFFYERPNNRSLQYLFTFCISFSYTILALLFILAVPFDTFLSFVLFQESDTLLFYLLFLSLFATTTFRYLNLTYRMEKNITMYTIQGIIIALVGKVLYIGVGFWRPEYKPTLIFLASSNVIFALIFITIQKRLFSKLKTIDKIFSKELFKYAIPLVPVTLLTWLNSSIPQIVMQNTMDYYSIGIFSTALHLANMVLIIQTGFNTFWVPYAYENYSTQTGQFYKVHKYLLCALTVFAMCIIMTQDVIFLILGEKFRAAKDFFPFLILGPMCYIIGETTGIGIDISKKTYYNIIIFVVSVSANILLSLLLSKLMGVNGIAIAVASSAVISMLLKTLIGNRLYHSVDSYRYIVVTTMVLVISSIATMFIDHVEYRLSIISTIMLLVLVYYKEEIKSLYSIGISFIKKPQK